MDLLVTSETVIYFKCPTDCLKLSQIVSLWTDIFQTSNIVSIFCLKLSQNKQGSTTGDIFNRFFGKYTRPGKDFSRTLIWDQLRLSIRLPVCLILWLSGWSVCLSGKGRNQSFCTITSKQIPMVLNRQTSVP